MKKHITLYAALVATAALTLAGCGSSSSDSATMATASTTGYLIDSRVSNVDYDCLADSDNNKVTGPDGAFTCQKMNQVRFRIGELVLGEIDTLPVDKKVFPQDLAKVDRDQIQDAKVTAMAQFLQSIDEDKNLDNGIQIPDDIKNIFSSEGEHFEASLLESYIDIVDIAIPDPTSLVSQEQARQHLRNSLQNEGVDVGQGNGSGNQNGNAQGGGEGSGIDLPLYPMSDLTDAQKYTLAYMWNEEKLAKDIYLALYENYPVQTFYNIATKAETKHQAMIEELIKKYDLNITNLVDYKESYSEAELRAFAPGEFGIQEIKDLYDALYTKGSQSQEAALKVGCMVEVTDVNDLDEDIAIAQGAADLVAVFENLRAGSYNHYWAFDKALKNMGVAEGCASLGEEYAKTPEEYPASNNQ
ncbi:MAG: DUF2202 domain-containing protein [Campylobacterota bacterium]|nr:DUF2202 domain-containing protein [Campylobacterota bacterium]